MLAMLPVLSLPKVARDACIVLPAKGSSGLGGKFPRPDMTNLSKGRFAMAGV
jgi:hypothetical protein